MSWYYFYFTDKNCCKRDIFFLSGRMGTHVEMKCFIPVHGLSEKRQWIQIAVFCLAGCSAFYGIGKTTIFKSMMQSVMTYHGLVLSLLQSLLVLFLFGALYG